MIVEINVIINEITSFGECLDLSPVNIFGLEKLTDNIHISEVIYVHDLFCRLTGSDIACFGDIAVIGCKSCFVWNRIFLVFAILFFDEQLNSMTAAAETAHILKIVFIYDLSESEFYTLIAA